MQGNYPGRNRRVEGDRRFRRHQQGRQVSAGLSIQERLYKDDMEAGRADIRDEVGAELLFGLRDSEREDLVLQARHLRERDKRQQGRSGT